MADSIKIQAYYDQDTYRCQRYIVKESHGIKGTLYINKNVDKVPERVIIEMKVRQ